MATGPITLLVDPAAQVYYDENGEHALPWHGPKFIGSPVGFPQDPPHAAAFTLNNTDFPETIVNRHGMYGAGTPLSDWTVTNGTKSSASYGETKNKIPDSDHFQSDIYGSSGQGYAQSNGNGSFTVLKAVSTGGDMDITTPLAKDSGTSWTARALMASSALVDREARFIINGVEQGVFPALYPPHMIPAGGVTVVHGAHDTGVQGTTGQAFGVRIKGTTVGEIFYLLMMGTSTVDEQGGVGFWPSSVDGVYPTEMLQDVAGAGVTTAWAGAIGNSLAHTGEAFWWVEITSDHIPDDRNFVLMARFHEGVRPVDHYGEEMGILNIGRYQAIYDYDETPGMFAEIGISDEYSFDPLLPRSVAADIYNATFGIDNSTPRFEHEIDYTGTNFVTYGLTVTALETEVRRGTESLALPWTKPPYAGWMGVDLVTPSDPLRFAPGHGRDHFHPSIGFYREMAIASRPLTDGEWAFLAESAGVWSFNMLAYPRLARIEGLETPLYRGDDRAAIVTIMDEDGDPVPLHGLKVWLTFKATGDNAGTDDAALLKFSAEIDASGAIIAGTGFEIVDALAGTLRARFEVPTQSMVYDVQVENLDGEIRTLLNGSVATSNDVTKRETLP
jgi:hypothetical protein